MIGKAKATTLSSVLTSYLVDPRKGYELDRNGVCSDRANEITKEFKRLTENNTRGKNKMFSLVLSPAIEDGARLSDEQLVDIGRRFMLKLNIDYDKQPFVMLCHTEKNHKHIHIYCSRVSDTGRLINDKYIGYRAQRAAHEIANELGLVSARDIALKNRQEGLSSDSIAKHNPLNNFAVADVRNAEQLLDKSQMKLMRKNLKARISIAIDMYVAIIKDSLSRKTPIQELVSTDRYQLFKTCLLKNDLSPILTRTNKDEIQGYRLFDAKTNLAYKATDISKEYSLHYLSAKYGIGFLPGEKVNKNLSNCTSVAVVRNALAVLSKEVKLVKADNKLSGQSEKNKLRF